MQRRKRSRQHSQVGRKALPTTRLPVVFWLSDQSNERHRAKDRTRIKRERRSEPIPQQPGKHAGNEHGKPCVIPMWTPQSAAELNAMKPNGLTGQGAQINTTTSQGKLVFGIFAVLTEFERDLISERTRAGLASARARDRKEGVPFKMTPAKLRLAVASISKPETNISDLCKELGITRQTLYRHVAPNGSLREYGEKLLKNTLI